MAIKEISIRLLNELTDKIIMESARQKFMFMAKCICGDSSYRVETEIEDEEFAYIEVYDKDENYLEFDFKQPIWKQIYKHFWEDYKDWMTLEEVEEGIKEDDTDSDCGQMYVIKYFFDLPYVTGSFTDTPILTSRFYIEE